MREQGTNSGNSFGEGGFPQEKYGKTTACWGSGFAPVGHDRELSTKLAMNGGQTPMVDVVSQC